MPPLDPATLKAISEVAQQSDRWLFVALLGIVLFSGSVVVKVLHRGWVRDVAEGRREIARLNELLIEKLEAHGKELCRLVELRRAEHAEFLSAVRQMNESHLVGLRGVHHAMNNLNQVVVGHLTGVAVPVDMKPGANG